MSAQPKEKLVKRVEDLCDAVNDMNRAMENVPSVFEEEKKVKLTNFQKKHPDVLYIEPQQKIPTGGAPSKAYHDKYGSLEYLTEYVAGVFESQMVGATFTFDLGEIPGEPYCRWKIPVNKPIGLPRFVAKHLSTHLAWKEMKALGQNQEPQAFNEEDVTKPFQNFETKRRGNFYPLNAY